MVGSRFSPIGDPCYYYLLACETCNTCLYRDMFVFVRRHCTNDIRLIPPCILVILVGPMYLPVGPSNGMCVHRSMSAFVFRHVFIYSVTKLRGGVSSSTARILHTTPSGTTQLVHPVS